MQLGGASSVAVQPIPLPTALWLRGVVLFAQAASLDPLLGLSLSPGLGIRIGDCVAFDPRVEVTNGFIRSRHLDDKARVANIVSAIKSMVDAGVSPTRPVYFHISNYEEVGHGASSGIPSEVAELLTVDMAVVGPGQESDEFHATICIKDAGGVYHEGMNKKLRALAEQSGGAAP